jgi:hypothetical protein
MRRARSVAESPRRRRSTSRMVMTDIRNLLRSRRPGDLDGSDSRGDSDSPPAAGPGGGQRPLRYFSSSSVLPGARPKRKVADPGGHADHLACCRERLVELLQVDRTTSSNPSAPTSTRARASRRGRGATEVCWDSRRRRGWAGGIPISTLGPCLHRVLECARRCVWASENRTQ